MADELAKVLTISDDVTQKMVDVIEKINDIESASNKMAKAVNDSYKSLAEGDINSYISKLSAVQSIIQAMSGNNATLKIEGLENSSIQAEKLATSTVKLATELNRTSGAKKQEKSLRELSTAMQLTEDAQKRLIQTSQRNPIASPTAALEYAKQAKSYAQQVQAIKYLESAYKQLGNTEAEVAKKGELATAMRILREQVRNANIEMGRTKAVMKQLSNWGEQLSRSLALVFSVSQIRNYIMQIAEVRGEFEKTEVSLTSILQNKDRADKLFTQVTELATRSPYTLKELTSYTKQLAAYQIEYKKLYGTTKMLADVAAGLGVDMSRLILAFGQVRAANFLRGTEVRQFTEAGLDILGELAKYYTELEGKIVTVGEVQDRVTKRMVEFGDVEEIFKRVTSAGGIFYNMQERQAQTLAGQMSNLKDRLDIMLNEIGKSNEGVLKGVVSALAEIVENWELVAKAIKSAAVALVLYKTNTLAVTAAQQRLMLSLYGFNAGGKKMINIFSMIGGVVRGVAGAFKGATVAVKGFFVANLPLFLLSTAIEAIIGAVSRYKEQQEALTEASNKYNERTIELRKLKSEYEAIAEITQGVNESDKDFAKRLYDQKVASLNKYKTKLQDLGLDEAVVETTFAPSKDDIDSQIETAQKLAETMQEWSLQTSNAIANVDAQWRYWTDDFTQDAQELGDATSAVFGTLTTNADAMALRFDKLKNILSRATPWLNIADIQSNLAPKREDESNEDYIDRSIKAYKELQKAIGYIRQYLPGVWADKQIKDFNTQLNNIIPKIGTYTSSLKEYRDETRKVLEERAAEAGGMDALRKQFEDHPLEFIASFNADLAKKRINEFVQAESYRSLPLVLEVKDKDFAGKKAEAEKLHKKSLEEAAAKAEAEKRKRELEEAAAKALERQKKALQESLTLVQKMGATYDKLEGKIGASSANMEVANRYRDNLIDSLSRAGVTDTSFVANMTFDAQGVISGLTRIADAVAKGSKEDVQAVIKEVQTQWRDNQIDLQFNANVDNLKSSIDDALSQYQMGKELSKLGLGDILTEQLFGVQTMDISDLREWLEVQKKLHTDSNGKIAKGYVKIFDEAEKKITELQNKETEDRVRKYASYLKKSVSERVRLEQEAAKKIAEVEAESKYTSAQKATIRSNIQKETQEALDKLSWSDFKSSGMYLDLFENLEQASKGAIDNMLNELENLRSSLSDLPLDQLKDIIAQIEKLREVKIGKSGLGEWFKNIKEGIKSAKQLPELEEKLKSARDDEKASKAQNDNLQKTRDFLAEQYDLAVKTYGVNSDEAKSAKNRLGIAEANLILSNEDLANKGKTTQELEKQVGLTKLQKKLAQSSIFEMLDSVSATGNAISNLHGALTDVFGELPTGLEDAFIYAEGLFAGVGDIEKGLGEIMSGKFLSGAINTLAGAFRTIGGIFGIGLRDVRRERDIERELALIEDLQKSYEKLEEAIDNAYSSNTYDQAQEGAIAQLEAQNKALERAQAAERDKKKTDQDRIDEWEQQKLDNLEKIAELERQAIEAYGGFGSDDNIKSAAEDFVSAWMDAFNETGNGLDALSDKMDDWLNNAIQKQLLMRLSDQYITPLLDQFEDMFSETSAGGRVMTKEEIEAWKRLYEQNSKEFDEKAKAYLDAIGVKPTGSESELSGLQRGIEGVTETTAQALEALLNSMRYYVSDSNNLLRQFYMSFISADETMNPMLYELKQHTTLLNAIHSLLNSTTKMTNNNGRALKVLMM